MFKNLHLNWHLRPRGRDLQPIDQGFEPRFERRIVYNGVWTEKGQPVFAEEGKPWKGFGAMEDITERTRAEAALRENEARLAAESIALVKLNELSSRLWHSQSLPKGLEEMLSATIELLNADMGNVQILDAERHVLHIAAQRGFKQDFLDSFREVSTRDDSACGRALRSGERIIVEDGEADARYAGLRSVARGAGYQAVQSTPLIGRDGSPLGMISTHWKAVHRPREADSRRLDLYIRQVVDFIERSRADEALRESGQKGLSQERSYLGPFNHRKARPRCSDIPRPYWRRFCARPWSAINLGPAARLLSVIQPRKILPAARKAQRGLSSSKPV